MLAAGASGDRLASLLQRLVAAHGCGLVLVQRRAVGLGDVSLWTVGFQCAVRLVLDARGPVGTGVGILARRRWLHRLGAIATISEDFSRRYRGSECDTHSAWRVHIRRTA